MDIIIQHPATLDNLNRLKTFLFRHPEQHRITILIDTEGQFDLMRPIREIEAQLIALPKYEKVKRQAILIINGSSAGEKVLLFNESNRPFSMEHLTDHAKRVVCETLAVINQLKATDQMTLLSRLGALHLEMAAEIELRPGWMGTLSRQDAEKMLEKQNIGTYLLREGDVETQELEDNIHRSNPQPFRCYVLTLVEANQKISDVLLVQRREGWTVYNDDPKLSDYQYYKDLGKLISSVGALHPIFSQR